MICRRVSGFDGTDFWYVERKTARCDLFQVSQSGNVLDSIPAVKSAEHVPGRSSGDGTGSAPRYDPNKPCCFLYKVDVTAKQIVDTIQVFGTQPTGITMKGDTLFYVMDGFDGNTENIYAVDLASKDNLVPGMSGSSGRGRPRGLAWDYLTSGYCK